MDWQQLTALAIVFIAASGLLWSRFGPRKFSFQKSGHCGCAGQSSSSATQGSIIFRASKGKRPQVLVKMK